ncbi:MAG: hypothetical protein JOY71_09895 [Acetobacteraceae bacterium]|nr:hypothetical protein [Acetobacteraceae bacterium]
MGAAAGLVVAFTTASCLILQRYVAHRLAPAAVVDRGALFIDRAAQPD